MRNIYQIFIFTFLWSFNPVLLRAQIVDSLPAPVELNEVFLNHSLHRSEAHTSAVPVQSLSGSQLQKINSHSVAEALRYFSGVQLKDYGGVGGLKTINVRSMGTQHTGVFFDGIAMGNAQNGQVDLGRFSLDNMEGISLYHGQRQDKHQSAKAFASANTIYLRTKSPEFKSVERFHLQSRLRGGSFGLFNPSLNADIKISDHLSARISSEVLRAHGRYKFRYSNGVYDTTAVRKNGDISAHRLEASLHGRQDGQEQWQLKYYHYDSERGLPGAVVANRFARPQRLWDRNDFLQADYLFNWSGPYSLKLRAKMANDYSRYLDPEMVTTKGVLENIYKQQEYYFSLAQAYQPFRFWTLSLATDVQHNVMQANLYRFAYPRRTSLLNALASNFRFKRVHLELALLSTQVYESVKAYGPAQDYQQLSPSMMFNVQPFSSSHLRLRGFYKKIFRMPTFNDLYYTFVGNTYLKPEFSEQVNLGFSFQKQYGDHLLHFSADAFKVWISDKIVAIPGTNLFRWTMFNIGEVETEGLESKIEVSGEWAPEFHYSFLLSHTYQKAQEVTSADSPLQQIPYTPVHSGSLGLMLDYNRFELNYSFIYTGERYSQKANIPSNYLQPWYTHDCSLAYDLDFHHTHKFKVGLEVNNIFDQQFAVIKNFPMPGRSFQLNLNYKF